MAQDRPGARCHVACQRFDGGHDRQQAVAQDSVHENVAADPGQRLGAVHQQRGFLQQATKIREGKVNARRLQKGEMARRVPPSVLFLFYFFAHREFEGEPVKAHKGLEHGPRL